MGWGTVGGDKRVWIYDKIRFKYSYDSCYCLYDHHTTTAPIFSINMSHFYGIIGPFSTEAWDIESAMRSTTLLLRASES